MHPHHAPKSRSVWPTLWVKVVRRCKGDLNRHLQTSWASQPLGRLLNSSINRLANLSFNKNFRRIPLQNQNFAICKIADHCAWSAHADSLCWHWHCYSLPFSFEKSRSPSVSLYGKSCATDARFDVTVGCRALRKHQQKLRCRIPKESVWSFKNDEKMVSCYLRPLYSR